MVGVLNFRSDSPCLCAGKDFRVLFSSREIRRVCKLLPEIIQRIRTELHRCGPVYLNEEWATF